MFLNDTMIQNKFIIFKFYFTKTLNQYSNNYDYVPLTNRYSFWANFLQLYGPQMSVPKHLQALPNVTSANKRYYP